MLENGIFKHITPLRSRIESIVRKLLGDKATDEEVQLCRMSIMSQAFRSMTRRRQNTANSKARKSLIDALDIEKIAEHVTRFSIDGISGLRKRIEEDRK